MLHFYCRLKYRVDETKASLAFGLNGEAPAPQDVYAFLPVRRYGLNFMVHVSQQRCEVHGVISQRCGPTVCIGLAALRVLDTTTCRVLARFDCCRYLFVQVEGHQHKRLAAK